MSALKAKPGAAKVEPNITHVELLVRVDGESCFVSLPQDRLKLLIPLAASLSENGKLPVVRFSEMLKSGGKNDCS